MGIISIGKGCGQTHFVRDPSFLNINRITKEMLNITLNTTMYMCVVFFILTEIVVNVTPATHSVRLHGMSGHFSSTNYPRNYTNNYFCTYYINGPQRSTVCIQFDDFQLERRYDYVRVFDGPSLASRSIGNYSGTDGLHVRICSTSSAMSLNFTTDYSIVMAGFNARYWVVMHGCSELDLTNGYTISSNLIESNATFNCIKGFDFSGDNISICLENSTWSNTNVSCQPK
ncbi:CSMD1-like protein, partial [Mya arenaria]